MISQYAAYFVTFLFGITATILAHRIYSRIKRRKKAALVSTMEASDESNFLSRSKEITPESSREESTASLEKAIWNYINIIKMSPNNPTIRRKLAELLSEVGREAEAEVQWTQAGQSCMDQNDFDQAVDIFKMLLRRNPSHQNYQRMLNEARRKRGDEDDGDSVGAVRITR